MPKKRQKISPRGSEQKLWANGQTYPVAIYLLKVNNRDIRTRYEICSKLTMKTPEWRHCRRSSIFSFNFEHISHLVLEFLLLALNR